MATPAMAQTTNGVIAGIISDAQGGVLPGVTVTARNVDTGAMRTITTEADGRFRLAGLNPGRYELKAELQGFGAVTVPDITVARRQRNDPQRHDAGAGAAGVGHGDRRSADH